MAKKVIKKKGLTFMSLELDPETEKKLFKVMEEEEIKGKAFVRRLIKAYLKTKE